MTAKASVQVISTVHWPGDPRLNRHIEYARAAGHEASFVSHRDKTRLLAVVSSLLGIARSRSRIVILPDPELFFLGSIVARLSGKRPVIDIHEDYPKAAMARTWVPTWGRALVGLIAAVAVWLGRIAAWRVMVASRELAVDEDIVVLNVPDPSSMEASVDYDGSRRLVYVGDITVARGALSMVEALGNLDSDFQLELIGRMSSSVRAEVDSLSHRLGVADRVVIRGQLNHADAWGRARGGLAGLNLLEPVPAYMDAVATKIWEYMAIGLPVIVSNLPGQARVVSEIDPGLVCDTPQEVAAMASRLAAEPGLRVRLGRVGRELVSSQWSSSRPDLAVQSALEP